MSNLFKSKVMKKGNKLIQEKIKNTYSEKFCEVLDRKSVKNTNDKNTKMYASDSMVSQEVKKFKNNLSLNLDQNPSYTSKNLTLSKIDMDDIILEETI